MIGRGCAVALPRSAAQPCPTQQESQRRRFPCLESSVHKNCHGYIINRLTRSRLCFRSNPQTVLDHASGAMDGLSAAASIIAVIQISEEVALLCSKYLKAVKNAKSDIERLQGELSNLKPVLEGAQKLLEGHNAARLETSRPLLDGLRGCYSQLKDLETNLIDHLKTADRGKGVRHFGLRALRWPSKSKKVDMVIQTLSKFRDTLSASLNIDQTYVANSSLATN